MLENNKYWPGELARADASQASSLLAGVQLDEPFLRIPPFPGSRLSHFTQVASGSGKADELASLVRNLRVGGSYWAAQPEVPQGHVLVRSTAAIGEARRIAGNRAIVIWSSGDEVVTSTPDAVVLFGECDPWHVLSSASALVAESEDEMLVIASLLGVQTFLYDRPSGRLESIEVDAGQLLDQSLAGTAFVDPFSGELMSARAAAELCGVWRRLIDSNRDIAGGLGFAFWKQSHVAPLLWGGCTSFRFLRGSDEVELGRSVAVWRSKSPSPAIAKLESQGNSLIEVEDGFLRSRGLGADCIPPLSITVDRLGVHFDPSQPSELEKLLEGGEFDEALLERAQHLRELIVESGIGKYDQNTTVLKRPGGERVHILVPGQVEDDRSVQAGGGGLVSNLELLARVRELAPNAYILYKPHPDVLAGHRRGAIAERSCLEYADEIVGELPVAPLIAMVDEVHVNTSLTGFEALLRGKSVTTYGIPFYAGWGLTCDLGAVPSRRTAKRTLDELVAATLLLYPRYLDPVTRLPCPAEVIVARLNVGGGAEPGLIVGVRRLQGKLMRRLRGKVQ